MTRITSCQRSHAFHSSPSGQREASFPHQYDERHRAMQPVKLSRGTGLSERIAQGELLDSRQSECLSVHAKLAYVRLVLKRSERVHIESD